MTALQPARFLTDSYNGTPVTFFDADTPPLGRALQLADFPHVRPRSAGVVRGDLRNDNGNEGNTLCTSAAPLQDGHVTVWRFAGFTPAGSGDFSVGMSTERHFGSSWAMRAISQRSSGNLCARGLEKGGWAQSYGGESSVEWYVELHDKVVDVYPAVDGRHQGHAFRLDFTSNPELIGELRPAVIFAGGCENLRVCLVEFEAFCIPMGEPAYRKRITPPQVTAEGKWELINASFPALVLPEPVLLTVGADGLSLKVCNTMRAGASFNNDGSVQVSGAIASTRMLPLPPFQDGERAMCDFLPTVTRWEVRDDQLILNDHVRFRVANVTGPPVTTNVFTSADLLTPI